MLKKFGTKEKPIFVCNSCDYVTSRKSQYDRHIETLKHCQSHLSTEPQPLTTFVNNGLVCDCGKTYKERTGLWRHKQKCNLHLKARDQKEQSEEKQPMFDNKDELIMFLIKENAEFKNMLLEQQTFMMKAFENGTMNNSHNTTTNSHNKSFNLQFFLNETCKDAMNIMDFVESIKLQVSDLERIGELGYTQGISDIITSNLKAMDITLRPVHCTDKKREVIYIKDNNEWKKEEDAKPYLKKAIKKVEDRNIRMLPQYRAKYPDHNDPTSKQSDKYDKVVLEAMGGIGNEKDKVDKIIRNISNVTTIDNKKYMS